jgi:hypothetical protein
MSCPRRNGFVIASESPKKRHHQQHGHHTRTKALKTIGNQHGWMESLGDVGEAMRAWKAAIIEDLGGEAEVSAMELSVIATFLEVATFVLRRHRLNTAYHIPREVLQVRREADDALPRTRGAHAYGGRGSCDTDESIATWENKA